MRIFAKEIMSEKIVIAIDGYSSCGKSTLAKDLARELSYIYIDSGAMYRAVTLFILQKELDVNDAAVVVAELPNIDIECRYNREEDRMETWLNGKNVDEQIRSRWVSENVSEISIIKEVRAFLVEQQRKIGADKGIAMDGRDIGTVVFKNAELKIFLTADLETRAKRRYEEMFSNDIDVTLEEVRENLTHRDKIDSSRLESPLFKADDALLFDNSILSRDEQLRLILNMAKKRIEEFSKQKVEN